MKRNMYMIERKVHAVWVPIMLWHEVQKMEGLERAMLGFDRQQAVRVINANREITPPGTRYRMIPLAQFLEDELG